MSPPFHPLMQCWSTTAIKSDIQFRTRTQRTLIWCHSMLPHSSRRRYRVDGGELTGRHTRVGIPSPSTLYYSTCSISSTTISVRSILYTSIDSVYHSGWQPGALFRTGKKLTYVWTRSNSSGAGLVFKAWSKEVRTMLYTVYSFAGYKSMYGTLRVIKFHDQLTIVSAWRSIIWTTSDTKPISY